MTKAVNTNLMSFKDEVFVPRLDFYWQSTAVYAIILIIYSLVRSSAKEGKLMLVVWDPVVILLSVFILYSTMSLLFRIIKNKTLIISKDRIILKSRFGEKVISMKEIKRISFVRIRPFRTKGAYKMIKIWLVNRKRSVRIRTSSYWNETRLLESISKLKSNFSK